MNDLPDLELTLAARPENVGVVRHVLGALSDALRLDDEVLDDLRLAVSEACANAVVHAYVGSGGAGLMDIHLHTSPRELIVSVRDHGGGMAPRADSPGLGVGLPLMASLAASMELLSPAGGGTEVRMRFPLSDSLSDTEHPGALRDREHGQRSARLRPGASGPRPAGSVHERRR
jgi:serine/threonine-protein kinase RsbW